MERLDEGHGIEAALVANNAQYHHTYMQAQTQQHKTAKKKKTHKIESESQDIASAKKRTRSHSCLSSMEHMTKEACFFCGQPSGTEDIHEAAAFQIDSLVRACATLREDTKLLGQLSAGDMVALEAKYHTNCLVKLYNRARKTKSEGPKDTEQERMVSVIVFSELVLYIEETWLDEETAPETRLDEETAPETRLDEETAPDTRLDEEAAPETRLDEETAPETRLDEETAPETRLDEEAAPETRLDEETAPETRLDEETAPETRLDEETAPETRLDEETAPETRLDEETAPETRLDDETAPETRLDEETAPVFRLADLVQLYQSRMEQLEV